MCNAVIRYLKAAKLWCVSGIVRVMGFLTDTPCLYLGEFTPELVAVRFSSHVLSLYFKRLASLLLELGQNSGRNLTGVPRFIDLRNLEGEKNILRCLQRRLNWFVLCIVILLWKLCSWLIRFLNEVVRESEVTQMVEKFPALEPSTVTVMFMKAPYVALLQVIWIKPTLSHRTSLVYTLINLSPFRNSVGNLSIVMSAFVVNFPCFLPYFFQSYKLSNNASKPTFNT
jgi:hypothetical protein